MKAEGTSTTLLATGIRPVRIGRIVLIGLFFTGSVFAEQDRTPLNHDVIRALADNGRILSRMLRYQGTMRTDTGFSYARVHRFQDQSGLSLLMLSQGLEKRRFSARFNYPLRFRFVAFTPGGMPIAKIALLGLSAPASPYQGDIREKDPRVKDIRALIRKGNAAPGAIRLRYSGRRGNYAAFYDLEGKNIYYRFRDDRFDRRALRKLAHVIRGQAYLVRGPFLGVILRRKFFPTNAPEYPKALADRNSILVFDFQGARPLRLEQILF